MYAKQTNQDKEYDKKVNKELKSQDRSIRKLKLKGIMELVIKEYSQEEIDDAIKQLREK